MAAKAELFRSSMEDCLCLEDREQREQEWHSLLAEAKKPDAETALLQALIEMKDKIRKQQHLEEEHQTLLNAWQREKDDAFRMLDTYREQMAQVRKELDITQRRMNGYERQFAVLQEAEHDAKATLKAVTTERDQAWEQFRDREEKLEKTSAELREVQADRAAAWDQFRERERQLEELRSTLQQRQEQIESLKTQLTDSKQYAAEMAAKVGEMEKMLPVRLIRRIHRA